MFKFGSLDFQMPVNFYLPARLSKVESFKLLHVRLRDGHVRELAHGFSLPLDNLAQEEIVLTFEV